MKNFTLLLFAIGSFLLVIKPQALQAQDTLQKQAVYYKTYPNAVTARIYTSKKYVRFTIPGSGGAHDITYKANTKQALGIGASYKNLSLDLGYGLKFLSKDNKERGKTKSLDAQVHFYPRKWAIDALAIRHKGAYLDKEDYTADNANTYYSRRDVQQNQFGLSAYYVLNGDRFSYRAAMLQNEWQTKSAGSLLVGATVTFGRLKGDSALVPEEGKSPFPQTDVNKINFITAGPGIGYAYTLVMAKHFFVMGSLVANVTLNYAREKSSSERNSTLGIEPGAVYKAAVGYNSDTWNISGNWAGNTVFTDNLSASDAYRASTGTFKVVLAKRLAF